MSIAELVYAVLLLPVAATVTALLPGRGERPMVTSARIFGLGGLVVLFWSAWLAAEPTRLALLLLPLSVLAAYRLKRRDLRNGVAIVGGIELVALAAVVHFNARLIPPGAPGPLSPDGNWEVQFVTEGPELPGGALYLVPRGLPTADPRAYPARTLIDFVFVSTPNSVRWTGPRELTVHVQRNSDGGPIVNENLGVHVVIEG